MTFFVLLICAVAVHELGHVAAAKIVGVPLVTLSVRPIGLSLCFDFSHAAYSKEAFVHAGGCIAGVIAAVLAALLPFRAALTFSGLSLTLAALNLLPLRSFDGGALIGACLSSFLMPDTAWRVCRALSAVFTLILWIGALWIELRIGANIALLALVCAVLISEIK